MITPTHTSYIYIYYTYTYTYTYTHTCIHIYTYTVLGKRADILLSALLPSFSIYATKINKTSSQKGGEYDSPFA